MKFQKLAHITCGSYGDILIAGNYQGGLRVVDISGELLGDIYKQGREIGHYVPYHKEGKIPNAPMVWGAQPYKDYIFLCGYEFGTLLYKT